MKKVLKGIGIFLLILVLLIAAFFAYLTITQLDPKTAGADVNLMLDREESSRSFSEGDSIDVLSWNIGYAGLGKEQDFFMDGGTKSRPGDPDAVYYYLNGIAAAIDEVNPDLVGGQAGLAISSRRTGRRDPGILVRDEPVPVIPYVRDKTISAFWPREENVKVFL